MLFSCKNSTANFNRRSRRNFFKQGKHFNKGFTHIKKIFYIINLPQSGNHEWSNWDLLIVWKCFKKKGKHAISLIYEPCNENMNEITNQVILDFLSIIQLN